MNNLDEQDKKFVETALRHRKEAEIPLIGDWVIMLDGSWQRFSHDWGEDIQTSEGGSFYLNWNGTSSFSGGLNKAIMKDQIVDMGHIKAGKFWIFHHNYHKAHNGVYFQIPCKVWRYCESVEAAQLYSDAVK